jgi:outer membrane receptor protein involved in Fe transport
MIKRILFLVLVTASLSTYAQKFTLSGYLKDAKSGAALIGATVYKEGSAIGAFANETGFYSIALPAGKHTISIMQLGYVKQTQVIDLTANTTLSFKLIESANELQEVTVASARTDHNVTSTEMGVSRMSIEEIKKIPSLMGEVDIIKSLQTLPGVTTVGEGATGFNVRGGNIDQNLILLDEAPVYNSSHLMGMFSVFNPDAVKDLKLMKGAIPAQYGGRVSSILDIRMKEGNKNKFEVNGGIGTVFSRLSIEGPIIKDKLSFIIAARRSYIDVVSKPFLKPELKSIKANFSDLTAKLNWYINSKNNISLSGYLGRDIFGAGFDFNYGNTTTTARWNHIYNSKWFSNLTAFYSNYKYYLNFGDNSFKFAWEANIINHSLKKDFSYYVNSRNTLKFGAQGVYYTFKPGIGSTTDKNDLETNFSMPDQHSLEYAVYINNEQKVSEKLSLQYGVRWSFYNYIGKGNAYYFRDTTPNTSKPLIEEKQFSELKNIKFYNVAEPRLAMNYLINNKNSIKASYSRSAQYLQMVSNTAASSPLDIYTPATNNIKPLVSDQLALGYYKNFKENKYEASAEVYYKVLQNQLDYIDNSKLFINKYLESDLLQGKGRAYGLELFVKKSTGKFTGWISYTLSKTERKSLGISNDDWYLSRYDRTHNANLVLSYEINKRFTVNGNFVYLSGTPATLTDSKLEVQGYYFPNNTENKRSNYRITAYHRLDLGVTYDFKKNDGRKWKSSVTLSAYNVYNRKNAFSTYFRNDPKSGNALDNEAIRYSVIGTIVPALAYNFKF